VREGAVPGRLMHLGLLETGQQTSHIALEPQTVTNWLVVSNRKMMGVKWDEDEDDDDDDDDDDEDDYNKGDDFE
jgi:hypothetical protein